MIQRNKRNSEISNKPTRFFSKLQENQLAKKFNGQRQPNSGATMFKKGDIVLDDILMECKTKTSPSQSITIHKSWLEKNNHEALFLGKKEGVLAFNFGPNEKNYIIMTEDFFKELLEGE